MTSQGLYREARAGVFALVCLSSSVALHGWASGTLPSVTAIVAGAGLALAVAILLAGRERGFPMIVAVLLCAQAGLHYLFESVPHAGHHLGQLPAAGPPASAMVAAHVVAGAFTAAWLRGGEVAAGRLCRWLARSVAPLGLLWLFIRPLLRTPFRPVLAWAAENPVALAAPGWRLSVIRRGPPVAHAA
jgi:hypothetical protein